MILRCDEVEWLIGEVILWSADPWTEAILMPRLGSDPTINKMYNGMDIRDPPSGGREKWKFRRV
jgi:hypothetical protein